MPGIFSYQHVKTHPCPLRSAITLPPLSPTHFLFCLNLGLHHKSFYYLMLNLGWKKQNSIQRQDGLGIHSFRINITLLILWTRKQIAEFKGGRDSLCIICSTLTACLLLPCNMQVFNHGGLNFLCPYI